MSSSPHGHGQHCPRTMTRRRWFGRFRPTHCALCHHRFWPFQRRIRGANFFPHPWLKVHEACGLIYAAGWPPSAAAAADAPPAPRRLLADRLIAGEQIPAGELGGPGVVRGPGAVVELDAARWAGRAAGRFPSRFSDSGPG